MADGVGLINAAGAARGVPGNERSPQAVLASRWMFSVLGPGGPAQDSRDALRLPTGVGLTTFVRSLSEWTNGRGDD